LWQFQISPDCSTSPKKRWSQIAVRPRSTSSYSPGFEFADFHLFGRLKQSLSGRTRESEHEVLQTVNEILREWPKNEGKMRFDIGRKDASGSRTRIATSIQN
jgi:hypothetical protein